MADDWADAEAAFAAAEAEADAAEPKSTAAAAGADAAELGGFQIESAGLSSTLTSFSSDTADVLSNLGVRGASADALESNIMEQVRPKHCLSVCLSLSLGLSVWLTVCLSLLCPTSGTRSSQASRAGGGSEAPGEGAARRQQEGTTGGPDRV
jgi:hypothetical protein